MLINISDIKKEKGSWKKVNNTLKFNAFKYKGNRIEFSRDVDYNLTIVNTGEYIHVEGNAHTALKVKCDRCLEPFTMPFSFKVDENFSEDYQDEYDVLPITDDCIDIGKAVKNNLMLNLPIKFICNQACKGLCPYCGINQNTDQCQCHEDEVDPRLAPLKKLLKDEE